MYAILGGDGIENFIKILPAVINQQSSPAQQVKMYVYYVNLFLDKILGMVGGNHEWRTKKVAGIDLLKQLFPGIVYDPHELKFLIYVGDIEYRIMVRHLYRYNSSMNLTHTVKRLWEKGDFDFDVGVVCHHHIPDMESFMAHGQSKWAIRPGSYKIADPYSREKGYHNAGF